MQNHNNPWFYKLPWHEAKEDIHRINPEFANCLDMLQPTEKDSVYKATYQYGDNILQNSIFHLRNEQGEMVPIDDPSIPNEITKDLGYHANSNPVCIVLNKSFEMSAHFNRQPIPFGVGPAGTILGTWLILSALGEQNTLNAFSKLQQDSFHPIFLWQMTAGARSIFMLPKISEATGHHGLKLKYHINSEKPSGLLDHWHVFKDLACNAPHESTWKMEIIYFSKNWFENLNRQKSKDLHYYLLQKIWNQTDYLRNKIIWDNIFSLIKSKISPKGDPYLTHTMQHLLYMASGVFPGFAPIKNDSLAPKEFIQESYLNDYKLKKYYPTLMSLAYFNHHETKQDPIYYSLQFPTTFDFSVSPSTNNSTIYELSELKYLMNKYLKEIAQSDLKLESTIIHEVTKYVDFEFFHSSPGRYTEIKNSELLANEINTSVTGKYQFPTNNTFTRGCVQIKRKDG